MPRAPLAAVSRNPRANCTARSEASLWATVSSRLPRSSLCNGPSCAIAFCCMCAATVSEFVHTRARAMASTAGSNRAPDPICLRSRPSQARPSLRRRLSSAKDCSSESVSSKSVNIKMKSTPRSCCQVHGAIQNPKWLLEAVRGNANDDYPWVLGCGTSERWLPGFPRRSSPAFH